MSAGGACWHSSICTCPPIGACLNAHAPCLPPLPAACIPPLRPVAPCPTNQPQVAAEAEEQRSFRRLLTMKASKSGALLCLLGGVGQLHLLEAGQLRQWRPARRGCAAATPAVVSAGPALWQAPGRLGPATELPSPRSLTPTYPTQPYPLLAGDFRKAASYDFGTAQSPRASCEQSGWGGLLPFFWPRVCSGGEVMACCRSRPPASLPKTRTRLASPPVPPQTMCGTTRSSSAWVCHRSGNSP